VCLYVQLNTTTPSRMKSVSALPVTPPVQTVTYHMILVQVVQMDTYSTQHTATRPPLVQ
jgi:hypothetical protein